MQSSHYTIAIVTVVVPSFLRHPFLGRLDNTLVFAFLKALPGWGRRASTGVTAGTSAILIPSVHDETDVSLSFASTHITVQDVRVSVVPRLGKVQDEGRHFLSNLVVSACFSGQSLCVLNVSYTSIIGRKREFDALFGVLDVRERLADLPDVTCRSRNVLLRVEAFIPWNSHRIGS